MNLLGAAELAAMRSVAAEALDGTAVIQAQQFVSDGGGGGTTTWTASGTVDCRLAPYMSGGLSESVDGGRLSPDSQVIFTFPANTSIDHNARIVFDGQNYEVTAVRKRSQELTRRVEGKVLE